MKTKDLINILKQYDPSGETEILIDNYDIDYIVKEPMYENNKGFLITEREKQKQPSEITLKLSGEKINLVKLDTFDYYQNKILNDQKFIKITTENDIFYWESAKLTFNLISSLLYCKEFLAIADIKLYPYKLELIEKINQELISIIVNYNNRYYDHCNSLKCGSSEKNNLMSIIENIFNLQKNIILKLPLVDKFVTILPTAIKNFKFELIENIIKFTSKERYNNTLNSTNINIETFDFNKSIGYDWHNKLNTKIENMLF